MKRTKHKILSVFLSFCMIISCMVGMSVTASAESKSLAVDTIYNIGDAFVVSEDGTVIVYDDGENETWNLADGSYTVPQPSYVNRWQQWYFNWGSGILELYLGSGTTNGTETVTGIKCVSGDGTSGNPYKFVLVCGSSTPATVAVTGVTLNKTETTLTVGDTETLTATVLPDNATDKTVTWASSDKTIAAVENGFVTAVAIGTATITATATNGTDDVTSDDKTATCTVTVVPTASDLQDLITSSISEMFGKLMSAGMFDELYDLLEDLDQAVSVWGQHQDDPDATGDDITEAYNDVLAIAAAAQAALEAFDAPKIISYSSESIGVYAKKGQEYTIAKNGSEPDWSNSQKAEDYGVKLFTDLTPATLYTIYTRMAGDTTGDVKRTDTYIPLAGAGMYGDPMVGSSVTVTPEPENAEGLTYQWYRAIGTIIDEDEGITRLEYTDEEEITGATENTYTLTEDDLGKYYFVKIYKDGNEVYETTKHGPVEYGTVIFETDGGSEVESITGLKYHDKVTKPADPTKDGYTFLGWYYYGDEDEELWDFDENGIEWVETILFAKWKAEKPAEETVGSTVTAPEYDPTIVYPAASTPVPTNNAPAADEYRVETAETEATSAEASLIEGALADGEIIVKSYEVKLFLDNKQVYEAPSQMLVKIPVPDELIDPGQDTTRTFSVIRIHGDKAAHLDAALNSADKTADVYSDLFSVYTLVYKDTVLSDTDRDVDTEDDNIDSLIDGESDGYEVEIGTDDTDTGSAEKPDEKPADAVVNSDAETNPHTGAPLAGLAVLAMTASAAAAAYTGKRKDK